MNEQLKQSFPWGAKDTELFLELTPERVLEAVEQAGLRTTGRCLQLNSMENRVYEVEIETPVQDNPSAHFRVVKFYRPGRWNKEQLLDEHEFLQELQSYEIPVLSPVVLDSGSTLGTIPDSSFYFSVFYKAGGRNLGELTTVAAAQLGRLVARMHAVGSTKKTEHRLQLDVATYGESSQEIVLACPYVPQRRIADLEFVINDLLDAIEDGLEGVYTQRIHGDCHLGNILWGADGPFLVDFDDMVVGPPMQDIWLMLPGRDEFAKRVLDQFVGGYNQMSSFQSDWCSLIEPLRGLRLLHFNAWISKRWNDASFQKTFPYFTEASYWEEQLRLFSDIVDAIENPLWL